MSTPQAIAFPAPRAWFHGRTLLIAVGVLVAIAVCIVVIALTTGGRAATATSPVTVSAAGASGPEVHYLGPRQIGAAVNPRTAQPQAVGTIPTADSSSAALHYTCLGAAERCVR